MSAQQFATAMALLAIVALVAAVTVIGLRLAGRRDRLPSPDLALTAAWAVAATATVGSLVLSEVFHFTPCKLCWYQRIAMYPLVVVLGIGAWRRDLAVRVHAVALAGIGAAISTWHVVLQRVPSLSSSGSCDPTAPCTAIWVRPFEVFTIPTMALVGFVTIIALLTTTSREADA